MLVYQPETQEEKEVRLEQEKQEKIIQECENFIEYVKSSPDIWRSKRCNWLRGFVSHVNRHPADFPPVDGDDTITLFAAGHQGYRPTKGYVQALAELRSTSTIAVNPVLVVYAVDTGTTRMCPVRRTLKL